MLASRETPRRRLLLELIEAGEAELRRRLGNGLPGKPAAWARALREEAARFYHSDAAQARRLAERSLLVAEITGEQQALGWGRRAMGEALLFSGRIQEADRWYREAAQAWRDAGASDLLGQVLSGHVHVLSLLGRFEEAERTAAEARRRLISSGDTAHLARLSMNLGTMLFQRDRYGEALRECDRAASLFRRLGVRDRAVVGLDVNRAVALTQLDRHEEALDLFTRLEQECGRRRYDLLRAQIWMNAAYVHSLRAEFDRALEVLLRATEHFRRTRHPTFLASCLLNRSEIYGQLNLHADALELLDEAVPLFASENLRYDQALATYQQALCHLAVGDNPSALRAIREGLALFRREANPARVALMRAIRGELYLRRGRLAQAQAELGGAARTFRSLGLLRWEATATVLRHEAGARGEPGRAGRGAARVAGRSTARGAVRDLAALRRRLRPGAHPLISCRILEALGESELRARRPERAREILHQALAGLEDIRIRIPTEESKIAFLQDKTRLHDRLLALEASRRRPDIRAIFDLMERTRSQHLWDHFRAPSALLDRLDVADGGPERGAAGARGRSPAGTRGRALSRQERQRRHLAWLHARLASIEMGSEQERAAAPLLERRLAEAEAAWRRTQREARESAGAGDPRRSSRGAGRLTLPELQERLPDGWGFVSYHVGEQASLLLAATRDGCDWRILPPDLPGRLAELCDRLDFQWGAAALASSSGDWDGTSTALIATTEEILAELHGALWQPLLEMMPRGPERWIVSPHGPIHRVPLHALLGPEGYLVERHDLSVVPSARIWSRLEGPRRLARSAWVAGFPTPELLAVESEVERVAAHLRGWRVRRDLRPTRAALRRHAGSQRLLHLAAHASLRSDNPAYSCLQLADGPFFGYDILPLRLPGSIVVLTACSTGRGERPAGDEWISLARTFLQRGASSVVMSLWPIEDEATLELMDGFYEAFARGRPVPEALGIAMRRTRSCRPHPWHWAAFAALGGVSGARRRR